MIPYQRSLPRSATTAASACFLFAISVASLRGQAPVFSEDFESGSLNQAVWKTTELGNATVTVQQTQFAHGKSALQIHYPKGEKSFAFVVASHLPDAVRNHFFGRAYLYISPTMPAGHDVLLNAGTPGYPISNFLEIGASGGKNVMVSYQQNAANIPRNETIARGILYPVGRWFCLEWEFQDHPDRITTWIDGEPAGELKDFVVKPRAPRAPKSHFGVPRPRKAGTKYTSSVVSTDAATASDSSAVAIICRSSRSHSTHVPADNIAPSSPHIVSAPRRHPMIGKQPPFDRDFGVGRVAPVTTSSIPPVPNVIFAMPGRTQPWPTSDACWSPTSDAMGG